MELGKLYKEGCRSKIYLHPTDKKLLIKVTSDKEEKKSLEYFFRHPHPNHVSIFNIEMTAGKMFAIVERIDDETFFNLHHLNNFRESRWSERNYQNSVVCGIYVNYDIEQSERKKNYLEKVREQILEDEDYKHNIVLVDEYYNLLDSFIGIADLFDVAYNLGLKNGKLCCYDAEIL